MFMTSIDIAPARTAALLDAAEAAIRRIPPAFPLNATVAVNPYLGQADEDAATAAARLARVAGAPMFPPRAEFAAKLADGQVAESDLAEALAACRHAAKPASVGDLLAALETPRPNPCPLPTVADLAAEATGTDWPEVIARSVGLWAAGHFDRGQALWMPAPGHDAFAAWRAWATRDLTPEIAGLSGFCAHVDGAPDTPERALLRAAQALGLGGVAAETAFHRLLMDLGGWAQHARWLLWQAEREGGTDRGLAGLLALRLVWEEALLARVPELAPRWQGVVEAHREPVAPEPHQIIDAIWQDAVERGELRRLAAALSGGRPARVERPVLQAAFCIDVRSEPFRRALEAQDPGIETISFAGFFGLPVAHRAHGSVLTDDHLPVLLSPALEASSQQPEPVEQATRIAARAKRAWGRFRQAAVSSFAFVEAVGPGYACKLLARTLGAKRRSPPTPAPTFAEELPAETRAEIAAKVLKAMGLTTGFAPLVLLLGHGARVTNNAHESAYHCGACGGRTGEVSARLLATLLNDPATRQGLAARGIEIPSDTRFVAGLHETTTDEVALFDDPGSDDRLQHARRWLSAAGAQVRTERALRLPGTRPDRLFRRAVDWAEVRPEWGLAGCSAFIAAPRSLTAGVDLGGRAFLHSYDWRSDSDFATLELILTAPVVVASWISLQYFGSSVAPEVFGSGNKLIHNVVGGIGVVQGNGGRLRAGLPWQAVHDGERLVHDPLRLTVMIEAPTDAISAILARHPEVARLFDNGWLHLLALEEGQVVASHIPGGTWRAFDAPSDETTPVPLPHRQGVDL